MRHRYQTLAILSIAAAGLMHASCSEGLAPRVCKFTPECDAGEICQNGICVEDSCQDGILSDGESDIDCGHGCKQRCEVGQHCMAAEDCRTGACEYNLCIDPESDCGTAVPGDLIIAEILNNVSSGKTFDGMSSAQSEFFEIVNLSNRKLALKTIKISCLRTDDGKNTTSEFKLSGCLNARQVLVVSGTPITDLPEDATNLTALNGTNQLTNTANYTCTLIDSSKGVLHTVKASNTPKTGVSEALPNGAIYNAGEETLAAHNSLSKLNHSPGFCTNGALYKNNCDTLCANGQKDSGETDTDCGGAICDACIAGKACLTDTDCVTKKCTGGICEKISCAVMGCALGSMCDETSGDCHACNDGIANGDETDIDCGGAVCAPCAAGGSCRFNDDCASYNCANGTCTGPAILCVAPQKGALVISEFYNRIKTGSPMAMYDPASTQMQAEFIEIVNLSGDALSLDGLTLKLERTDTNAAETHKLTGCIAAHQATVLSGTPIADLPTGVRNIVVLDKAKDALVNTAPYRVTLLKGQDVLHTVHENAAPSNYISRVLPDLTWSESDPSLVNHDILNEKLKQSPGYCTNGALYTDGCTLTCENGIKDNNESDVDCGGVCDPCAEGLKCAKDADCVTENCAQNTCGQKKCTRDTECQNGKCDQSTGACSSCADRIKNGDETDIDCGGTICGACDAGRSCQANVDCLSYQCTQFKCVGAPVEALKPGELVINEIMGSPNTAKTFSTQPNTPQCEYIELVSIADKRRKLDGWTLNYRTPESSATPTTVPIFGILEPHHGIVIHNCSELPLPDDMTGQTLSGKITNGAAYDFWLENDGMVASLVTRKANSADKTKGVSQNRKTDMDIEAELVFHTEVSNIHPNTPGYCANGGRFSENCMTTCTNNVKDNNESDVDCGGACLPCANGKTCQAHADCASSNCANSRCDTRPCTKDSECTDEAVCDLNTGKCISCSDSHLNGDETDVDCGGTRCSACSKGQRCRVNTDCLSMTCTNSVCTGTDLACVTPKPGDIILTEVLNSASISTAMQTYAASSQKQVEFIEIANLSGSPLTLDGLKLKLERQNATEAVKWIDLKGCLPAYQAAVISGSAIAGLPDGVLNILALAASNALTNTATYLYTLVLGDTALHQVIDTAAPSSQKSRIIPELKYASAVTSLVDHSTVNSALKHSPGYCTNGMLYVNHCASGCQNSIKDGDETDVDCGGSCSACAAGKKCAKASDCQSGQCANNYCTGAAAAEAAPSDVMINEVMGTPNTSIEFNIAGIADKQCEFVEIVNISGKKINLSGLSLYRQKALSSAVDPKPIALSGILEAGEVLVVSECTSMNLPYDAHHLKASLGLANGDDYILNVRRGSTQGQTVIRAANSNKSGVSQNRAEDLSTASDTLKFHTEISTYKNSPGYCANGNTFKKGCK
ncbi:MAG: lamin tail domain-containing protein [Proteobacteria bacterium]|nr:lamin tail domain-containing protein [Pseudomonadota bacterium]